MSVVKGNWWVKKVLWTSPSNKIYNSNSDREGNFCMQREHKTTEVACAVMFC